MCVSSVTNSVKIVVFPIIGLNVVNMVLEVSSVVDSISVTKNVLDVAGLVVISKNTKQE